MHCHYPMHLLGDDDEGRRDITLDRMVERKDRSILNKVRALLMQLFARRLNDPTEADDDWRVSLDRLIAGQVGVAFSVLYDPFSEIDLGKWWQGAKPDDSYFKALVDQLDLVEEDLARQKNLGRRSIVKTEADLDAALAAPGQVGFVHCVEGGFHLGRDVDKIDARVGQLAGRGVRYITLAHLFWRRVATNAPALPFLSERLYPRIFCQPKNAGLTDIGEAAVRAMYRHRVMVDVSHMRADAMAETFQLLDDLDREHGKDPRDFPVIASHAGYRFGDQTYMLDEDMVRKVARRDGVVGLILARHQLENGLKGGEGIKHTVAILGEHIERLREITGSHEHTGLGTDLDGFIKPTMSGVEHAEDLAALQAELRTAQPQAVADQILGENALRVLRKVLP